MVKKIKKRTQRNDELENAEALDLEVADEPETGIRAELEALAEDGFTARTVKGLQWLIDNRVPVIVLLAAVLVGLIGTSVYQRWAREKAETAAAAFRAASEAYLKVNGTGAPGASALEGDERKAQLEKARDAFAAARNQHRGSQVALLSQLGEASALYDLGDFDGALNAYNAVLEAPDLDVFTRAVALQGKAAALESKGSAGEAQKAWKALEALDAKAYGMVAGLQIGRILEASGKKAEARAHYEGMQKAHADALKSFSNAQTKRQIERRLEQLGSASGS